jgi:hypothetical protein
MKPIQPIQYLLVLLLIAGIFLYVRSLRSRLLDRLLVLVIGLSGLLLVVMPDWSTALARRFFGVGRGADLVTYLGLVGLGYFCLLLFARVRETNERLTQLARSMAIQQARLGPDTDPPREG